MSRFARHSLRSFFLLIILLPVLLAGCSDDDPITGPTDVLHPFSYVWQVNSLPDGTTFAAGQEGRSAGLFSNTTGAWGTIQNAPSNGLTDGITGLQGVMALSLDDVYVFALPTGIYHLETGQWVEQPMDITLSLGLLKQTPRGLWCLGAGGILMQENEGQWNIAMDQRDPLSILSDIAESPDETVFVSQFYLGEDIGKVHRISSEGEVETDSLDGQVYALASTATDTVWAAGDRLFRFAETTWDTVVSIPDTNLVVAIGQPEDGSLTLICEMGAIYSWQDEALTVIQEFDLRAPLASVCYIAEDEIYGSMNYDDDSTGDSSGIIVRFDGTQWITAYLAPLALK